MAIRPVDAIHGALMNRDLPRIVELLERKDTNVDLVHPSSSYPLWLQHVQLRDYAKPEDWNPIWNAMILRTNKILDANPNIPGKVLADSAWSLRNIEAASLILLRAMPEGYRPNLGGESSTQVARIHKRVRRRLSDPQTELEYEANKALEGPIRDFWLTPLSQAKAAQIIALVPMPAPTRGPLTEEARLAWKALHAAGSQIGDALSSKTPGASEEAGFASADAREALEKLRSLAAANRLRKKTSKRC